ncbi:MAG: BamA/TamA family outer membrane protein [Planctomycetota bacterium]|nr:BamA/TamA family outer membrane protein [Planctomycetota bacterium]
MTRELRAPGRVGAALALGVLLAGCSLLGQSPEPRDVGLVFEGLGAVPREDAVRRLGYVFEDFAQVTRPGPVLDDAAFELELMLQELGFREARVETVLERPAGGRPIVRFLAEPGVRTRLVRVTTPGVPESDQKDVRLILRGAGAEGWYSARAVEAGASAILEWYRERGHVDAAVAEPRREFTPDGAEARVEIAVTPGPVYRLTHVDVLAEDAEWPASVPRARIDDAIADLLGGPYSERVMRTVRGRVANVMGEHGHPDASVVLAKRDLDPTGVGLAFSVRPGPRVRVGAIEFQGQHATDESFLRKRVELEEGAWFQRSLLRASLANLARAGIFDRIAIDLAPAASGPSADGTETRDVVVDVEEAAAREFHIEPGYGSYEGLRLGFGARQKNLFGSGRILDFSATVSQLAQRADLSLIDPWILGPDATAIATLFWNRRQEPSFLRLEQGLELGVSWRLSQDLGLRTSWQYRKSDVSAVEVDAPEFVDDADISEISIAPTWDTRDAFDDPHAGQITRGGVDLSLAALGSQLEYVRLELEHSRFLPVGPTTTLALSARAGWIAPIGSTDEIPIQERFFNGGENSVRSYSESELGPVDDNGQSVGGEASTTATIELRQKIWKRVQLAAFVDAGTVELRHEDVFRFTDPGFGLGLGLRYLLPIGPIRLDGAVNPDPGPGEADGAIHLSVGFSF